MSTPTSILPTAAQKTVPDIDKASARLIAGVKANIAQIERYLSQTLGDDGKTKLTADQVISAAGGRLDNIAAVLAAIKTAVNTAVPGSYPA